MKPGQELARLADKIFVSAAVGMGVLILITYLIGLSIFVFSSSHKHQKVIQSTFDSAREEITVAVYNNRITQAFKMSELPELRDYENSLRVNDVEAKASVRKCGDERVDEISFELSLLPGMPFQECVFVKQADTFVSSGVILGCLLALFSLLVSCGGWFLFRGRFKKRNLEPLILSLESEARDAAVGKMASQLAHDIRSPLAALNIFMKDAKKLPEEQRLLVRSAVSRIQDIANNLLPKTKKSQIIIEKKVASIELLPSLVDRLVSEKRMQYKNQLDVDISLQLDKRSYNAFAKVASTEILRVISNLIDNAVEALPQNSGKVVVSLKAMKDFAQISVFDNGVGIPEEIIPQLMKKGNTFNKRGGSGLGLAHAKSVVEGVGGEISIESELGRGTIVRLRIQREAAPEWFKKSLRFDSIDQVLIVDDDLSIHQTWNSRLNEEVRVHEQGIEVQRLSSLREATDFVESGQLKERSLLLVDFEFVGSEVNGFEWIKNNRLASRSVLVTSHFEEKSLQDDCQKLSLKMIPKTLSPYVPIVGKSGSVEPSESTWTKAVSS